MAGYSGTPLAKKVGIKPGQRVGVVNRPPQLADLLSPLPEGAEIVDGTSDADLLIAFYTERAALERDIDALARAIHPDRGLWLAWPKKTSGVATDLTGDVIRGVGLAAGIVDIKVCAIDDTWSGHRFAVRRTDR